MLLIPWFRWEPWVVRWAGTEIAVFPYQVTVALAILTIITAAALFSRKQQRSIERTLDFLLYVMICALPCALLASVLLYQGGALARFFADPVSDHGLQLHWSTLGGLIGGSFGAALWWARYRADLFGQLDVLAFALPFGWCLARIGCFGVHDHAGRVSDFALAVADFRFGVPPYEPRHDMGLYDAMTVGAIALLFAYLARRRRPLGLYLALLLTLYPPIRFFLDFLRATEAEGGMTRFLGLTYIQYIAALLWPLGLVLLVRVRTTSRSWTAPANGAGTS